MSNAHDLVRELLRSSDEAKVVLEAVFIPSSGNSTGSAEYDATHDPRQDAQNKRILAVISHRDDWDLTEEGCVFVCKFKSPGQGQPEELDIQRVLPIYGNFSIVMSQMRRSTLDLRAGISKAVVEQPHSGFSFAITPAEGLGNDGQPPLFFTLDVQDLRNLVTECKRLKGVSDIDFNAVINVAQSTTHFSWLRPYILKQISPAAFASVAPDIRSVNKPIIERLTSSSAGQPGDDYADVQLMRDEWVRTKAREASRRGRRRLTLRIGTFNVNGKLPSQDLSGWVQGQLSQEPHNQNEPETQLPPIKKFSPLSLGGFIKSPLPWARKRSGSRASVTATETPKDIVELVDPSDPDPDVLVFGFQELDLSTEALIYSTSTFREDAWCVAIFAALGEKAVKYEKLASKQLVGMLIVVIVKKNLRQCFGEVRTTSAGAGILGVMGNKGGTAVQLLFTPPKTSSSGDGISEVEVPGLTTLTFVNAHLAAFDEMVDKRNQDFQDLSKRLTFEVPIPHVRGSEENDGGLGFPLPTLSVYDSDALFWMVNLNYRVDLPDIPMRQILSDEEWDNKGKFEVLLRYDQLKKATQSEKAFVGFMESDITHLPTYRFSPGLAMDALGYDLKRKPAWTDRILYIPSPACRVEQLSYTGHPQITMSDHRPVAADFRVDVDLFDEEEYYTNLKKYYREVDHLEVLHERKGLKIDDTYVDFGNVLYDVAQSKLVKVTNSSKLPCAFRFVPVQSDAPIHPEWLSIHPQTGILLPEETVEVTLTAYVDNTIAALLNRRPKDLSGTLILHTLLGKDHFISVAGEYQYTCFANTLSRLTQLPGPIRSLNSPNDLLDDRHRKNAPSEVIRLVNWLMTNNLNVDNVFLSPADEATVANIRECLDTGDEFPYPTDTTDPHIPLAFGVTMLRLLDSLADPVIPGILHPRCVEMSNRDEAFELLDAIHPAAVNVWISVTAFLHFISKISKNEDHAKRIASVFAPILLPDDPTSLSPPISPAKKQQFILFFIS